MPRLPVLSAEAAANLSTLHGRVDAFFVRVHAAHEESMACARGCSGCCHQNLEISPVEMARILEFLSEAPRESLESLMGRVGVEDESGSAPCVLLEDDACMAYAARPTICRSHGLVIRERSLGKNHRDVCPLNFTESPGMEAVPEEDVLDLERLNQMLALINELAMPETGRNRLSIQATIHRWFEQSEAD